MESNVALQDLRHESIDGAAAGHVEVQAFGAIGVRDGEFCLNENGVLGIYRVCGRLK